MKKVSSKEQVESLEAKSLAEGNEEAWLVLQSGLNNAADTWRELRKADTDYYSESYFAFALDSARSLLCDSASEQCGKWFVLNGLSF